MDAREGRYGCTRGPIMGFESRAISARVTTQIVTIFSKTCDKHDKQIVAGGKAKIKGNFDPIFLNVANLNRVIMLAT